MPKLDFLGVPVPVAAPGQKQPMTFARWYFYWAGSCVLTGLTIGGFLFAYEVWDFNLIAAVTNLVSQTTAANQDPAALDRLHLLISPGQHVDQLLLPASLR